MLNNEVSNSLGQPLLSSWVWSMVSDLHLPLGHAQVEAVQDLQFAVRLAHVPAEDRKILLSRRQGSLQISLHFTVLELAEEKRC